MFFSELKNEQIAKLKNSLKHYAEASEMVKKYSEELYGVRKDTVSIIGEIESFINTIANTPKSFVKEFEDINVHIREFNSLEEIGCEFIETAKISGGTAGAGTAAGIGVAALGPSAAMAIATTFGSASTGTAISALSGAAATNAALAWLGGGTLAAGGGGMAAGEALLALAGPIGWSIAGISLTAGAILIARGNKKGADKAFEETIRVEYESMKLKSANKKIIEIRNATTTQTNGISVQLSNVRSSGKVNYNELSNDEKFELGALVNNTKSLAKLLIMNLE